MDNNPKIDTKLMFRPLLIIVGFICLLLFCIYLIQYYYNSVNYAVIFILTIILSVCLLFIVYNLLKLLGFFDLLKRAGREDSETVIYLKNRIYEITRFMRHEYYRTSRVSIIILIIISTIITLYFVIPVLIQKISIQGGKQFITDTIDTNISRVISSYEKLNGSPSFEYQYGISFWFFIHSFPPSTNSNYNKFTSILNYGNKPNILYNPNTNTLMITTEQKGLQELNNTVLDFDDTGNRIIYRQNNILLQKWNNMTINYSNGTLDVFLNGKLVKSAIEVVPYMTLDNLVVGSDRGISGGICNLVYFKKPLNAISISYLYNMVKDKSPPIN